MVATDLYTVAEGWSSYKITNILETAQPQFYTHSLVHSQTFTPMPAPTNPLYLMPQKGL